MALAHTLRHAGTGMGEDGIISHMVTRRQSKAVTFIFLLFHHSGPRGRPEVRKWVVLAPSSLCSQWASEFNKFFPPFRAGGKPIVLDGTSCELSKNWMLI